MTIPELIARQNRMNLTNIKLAERLGVTPEHYSCWRNGHKTIPADLDARLATIEQAYAREKDTRINGDQSTRRANQLMSRALLFSLDLDTLPDRDPYDNPKVPAGTMYWQYSQGFLHRRARAAKHYNDGYDGIFIPPSWVGLDLPGADATPYT